MSSWTNIEKIPSQTLTNNRKSIHQAVQLVSAFARNILEPDPTDGRSSLIWNNDFHGLVSVPLETGTAISIGISFTAFELLILENGKASKKFSLEGSSVNKGLEWLKTELKSIDIASEKINLTLPYEIEDYDYDSELLVDSSALEAFAALYGNTANILDGIVKKWSKAFDIRCWPHHFDIATLIPIEEDNKGEMTKSIGVGLSPGDDQINEPYIYVNVWPQIDFELLSSSKLSAGNWNKEGWSGSVLNYSDFINGDQQKIQEQFISEAFEAILNALK